MTARMTYGIESLFWFRDWTNLQVDGHEVVVDCGSGKVKSTNLDLGARIEVNVLRMMEALKPVDVSFGLQQ